MCDFSSQLRLYAVSCFVCLFFFVLFCSSNTAVPDVARLCDDLVRCGCVTLNNPTIPMTFEFEERRRHGGLLWILMIATNDGRSCCFRFHGSVCVDGVIDHGLYEVTILFIYLLLLLFFFHFFSFVCLLIHICYIVIRNRSANGCAIV